MPSTSVIFDRPPIIELVLGVQFAPLAAFTTGHSGWFWKEHLGGEWVKFAETVPILDQFETFDDKRRWGMPDFRFSVRPTGSPPRAQISTESGDRMIQIQPTRFHYNWRKGGGDYPSYLRVRDEFDRCFAKFAQFVDKAKLGELVPNQWEITYVDHIERGELWQRPSDWHKVLPGLLTPGSVGEGIDLESVGGEWHFEIVPHLGRLHIGVQYGRLADTPEPVLVLNTTARGPIRKEGGLELNAGLALGHDKILQSFLQITSPLAQRVWQRRDS